MKPQNHQIKNLDELLAASLAGRAVSVPSKFPVWHKPRPAAFMINLSGYILQTLMQSGMFVYEPQKKKKV